MRKAYLQRALVGLAVVVCVQCTKNNAPTVNASALEVLAPAKFEVTLSGVWIAEGDDCVAGLKEIDSRSISLNLPAQVIRITSSDADPNLSYRCLILKINDSANWMANQSVGGCKKDVEVTDDLCPIGKEFTKLDGSKGSCDANTNEIFLRFNTSATGDFLPLNSPIELARSTKRSGFLFFDTAQMLEAGGEKCSAVLKPKITFYPDL